MNEKGDVLICFFFLFLFSSLLVGEGRVRSGWSLKIPISINIFFLK